MKSIIVIVALVLPTLSWAQAGSCRQDSEVTRRATNQSQIQNQNIIASVEDAVLDFFHNQEGDKRFKIDGTTVAYSRYVCVEAGYTIGLELVASTRVKATDSSLSGYAECRVTVFEGDNYDWSWDGSNASADCTYTDDSHFDR